MGQMRRPLATLTTIRNSRWPGGQSHISGRKIYIGNELCSTKDSAWAGCRLCACGGKDSIRFHFAFLCSGHRGHSGHRFFRFSQMDIRGLVFFGAAQAWLAIRPCIFA